jgi:hypothetical protein
MKFLNTTFEWHMSEPFTNRDDDDAGDLESLLGFTGVSGLRRKFLGSWGFRGREREWVGLTSQLGVGVTTLEEVDEVCCCCLVGLGTRTDKKEYYRTRWWLEIDWGKRGWEGMQGSWVVWDSVGRWPTLHRQDNQNKRPCSALNGMLATNKVCFQSVRSTKEVVSLSVWVVII